MVATYNETRAAPPGARDLRAVRGEYNVLAYALGVSIGDGASHPLSGSFPTLAAAQAVYPHATALTDELAWAAIMSAIAAAPSGARVYLPRGYYQIGDGTIAVTKNLTLGGVGYTCVNNSPYASADWTNQARMSGTVLFSTLASGTAISCVGTTYERAPRLEGFLLVGPGSGTAIGVTLGGALADVLVRTRVTDVMVANFPTTWLVSNVLQSTLIDVHSMASATAFDVFEGTNQNVFLNISAEHSTADGISLRAGALYKPAANKFVNGLLQNVSGRSGMRVEAGCEANSFDVFYCEAGVGLTNLVDLESGSGTELNSWWLSSNAGSLRVNAARTTIRSLRSGGAPALLIDTAAQGTQIFQSDQLVITDNSTAKTTMKFQPVGATFGSGGSALLLLAHGSATLDFPSIAAGATADMNITVPGAVTANAVAFASPFGAPEAGLVWSARVTAANTVQVRVANVTSAAIDPGSRVWHVAVFGF